MKITKPISIYLAVLSCIIGVVLTVFASPIAASQGSVLGIHILNPSEIEAAATLLKTEETKDSWQHVTIPLTLNDLDKDEEWQQFFDTAQQEKVQPIVRLSTRYNSEIDAWEVPDRREIIDLMSFLDRLDWPRSERPIIILNETNHAKEFGDRIAPDEYATILQFASRWAQTSPHDYVVLPAAMDLAAPNGPETMEAFRYLRLMLLADPGVFDHIDAWNSHSYANPGFSSSPLRTDKMSMRGYQHELAFITERTGRNMNVYITETGWVDNARTGRWLDDYYRYTFDNIWSDDRIQAVTPFILQGAPGPFEGFSFMNAQGEPTRQYRAYRALLFSPDSE